MFLIFARKILYTGLYCLRCYGTYRIAFHITPKAECFLLCEAYRIATALCERHRQSGDGVKIASYAPVCATLRVWCKRGLVCSIENFLETNVWPCLTSPPLPENISNSPCVGERSVKI